jgi:lipopolysaccharide transport system permease protein
MGRLPLPAPPPTDDNLPETEIRARTGWVEVNWRELYDFRELLFFLAWRDVKVRYKQTALGVAWAVVQPFFTMLIFTLIFGRFARIPSDDLPYSLFVFAGLIPWTFVNGGVTSAAQSLIQQQTVLSKVYFPRLFVPTATFGPFLVDMLISFALYGLLLAYHGFVPSWQVVFLPALIALTLTAALGLGFALAALIVVYRDLRHALPFVMQVLMFVSPVIYPVGMLPPRFQWLLALNPLSGIIGGYRSAVLGTPWNVPALAASAGVTAALFAFGLFYFRKTERLIADIA